MTLRYGKEGQGFAKIIAEVHRGRPGPTHGSHPIDSYENLLEDLHDLGVIIERRDEPGSPLEEVEARLRADGRLPDRD